MSPLNDEGRWSDEGALDDAAPARSPCFDGGETLTISGLPISGDASGDSSVLPARMLLFVQRHRTEASVVAERITADMAAGWRSLLGDPAPALGLGLATTGDDGDADVLHRREAVLAEVQEHYYSNPPRIERA